MKVELLSHDASDLKCVNAARVSYKGHSNELTDRDKGLIKAMIREKHGSVFEHSTFTFRVQAPIIVLRQWQRHRAGWSYNEASGRYIKLEPKFYRPRPRMQTGKAMDYKYESLPSYEIPEVDNIIHNAYVEAYALYEILLDKGVAKECARFILPQGIESEMYTTCNARSLMHWLGLRGAEDASEEIRLCSIEAETYFKSIMPITWKAFNENNRQAP